MCAIVGRDVDARSILANVGTTGVARELKHVQVREHVRGLLEGAAAGTPAPSERELVRQFGVARMTVRQALDTLVADGMLERVPGRGTFVAHPRPEGHQVLGFTDYVARRGSTAGARTVRVRLEQAGPGLARALGVEVGASVVRWRRIRTAAGDVVGVQDSYLNEELVPHLIDPRDLSTLPDSLYAALAARDLRPSWTEDSVRADLPTAEECSLLDLEEPVPVLRVSRRAMTGDTVVEVSRSTYRSDRFTLYLQFGSDA